MSAVTANPLLNPNGRATTSGGGGGEPIKIRERVRRNAYEKYAAVT